MRHDKSAPFFAIVLCTHNGQSYIGEQLESIACQTYSKFVVFLNDWGSSDKTLQIVADFAKRYPEMIVVLEHSYAPGPCESFLEALKATPKLDNFDYILFCDQDDFWVPNKLDRLAEHILERGADLIHHDVEVVDSELNTIHESFYDASKFFRKPFDHSLSRLLNNPLPGMSMCFSKRIAISVNQLNITTYSSIMMHDWLVLLVVIFNDYESYFVEEKLVKYRQHDSNILGFRKKSFVKLLFHLILHFRNVSNQFAFIEQLFGKRINSFSVLWDVLNDSSLTFLYRIFLIPVIICIFFHRLSDRVCKRVK